MVTLQSSPTTSMERIEDMQLIINHIVKEAAKANKRLYNATTSQSLGSDFTLELLDLPNGNDWDGRIAYLDRDSVINVGRELRQFTY